jgi:hypothetical protein
MYNSMHSLTSVLVATELAEYRFGGRTGNFLESRRMRWVGSVVRMGEMKI